MIKNNLMPFLAGIFLTVFVFMIIVIFYIYGENSDLRREVNDVKNEMSKIENKLRSPESTEDKPPAISGNNQAETYLIPNQIPTRPSIDTPPTTYENKSETDRVVTQLSEGSKIAKPYTVIENSGNKKTFTIDKEVEIKPVTGSSNATRDQSSGEAYDESGLNISTSSEGQTYTIPNKIDAEYGVNSTQQSNADIKVYESNSVYVSSAWEKLKNRMTKVEVKDLLGNPTKTVSKISSTIFIYSYIQGTGEVSFGSNQRVTEWKKPI